MGDLTSWDWSDFQQETDARVQNGAWRQWDASVHRSDLYEKMVFTNVSRLSKPVNPGSFNWQDLKRIRQASRLRLCVVGAVPTFFMLSVLINPL